MSLTREGEEKLQRKLEEIGVRVASAAKRKCPVDTGRLRSSITYKVVDDRTVVIGTPVKYAPYVEYGTSPHFPPPDGIKPWVRRVLNPENEEELERLTYVISKTIAKRGTKPQPFLRPAFDEVRNQL